MILLKNTDEHNNRFEGDRPKAGFASFRPVPQAARWASLPLYRSATTMGLLDVTAQDIEEGLAVRRTRA